VGGWIVSYKMSLPRSFMIGRLPRPATFLFGGSDSPAAAGQHGLLLGFPNHAWGCLRCKRLSLLALAIRRKKVAEYHHEH
jgi:hypothetical protein